MATSSSMTTMRCFMGTATRSYVTRGVVLEPPRARRGRLEVPPAHRGSSPAHRARLRRIGARLRPSGLVSGASGLVSGSPAAAAGTDVRLRPARRRLDGARPLGDARHVASQHGDLALELGAHVVDASIHAGDLFREVVDTTVHLIDAGIETATYAGNLRREQPGHQQENRNEGSDNPPRVAVQGEDFGFRHHRTTGHVVDRGRRSGRRSGRGRGFALQATPELIARPNDVRARKARVHFLRCVAVGSPVLPLTIQEASGRCAPSRRDTACGRTPSTSPTAPYVARTGTALRYSRIV